MDSLERRVVDYCKYTACFTSPHPHLAGEASRGTLLQLVVNVRLPTSGEGIFSVVYFNNVNKDNYAIS